MACFVSNLSASVGGLTWLIIDYIQLPDKKWGTIGWCSGAVAGLVAITPAAGFVPPWSALIFGAVSSFCCNHATRLKFRLRIDEHLDIFAIHAVGGVIGNILTYVPSPFLLTISGVFADNYIAALDGVTEIDGGWLNGHWIQVPYQLCNCVVGISYSFIMTSIILFTMNISGLTLRVTEDEEERGIDDTEIGYFAYDYVNPDAEIRILDHAEDSIRSRNNAYGW
jgi:ammonium transporter, Amt family